MNKCNQLIKTIQETLKSYSEIQIATLFGSAAKNRLTPYSDIDISVAAAKPILFEQKMDIIVSLSKTLPYSVDLIDLQSVSGPILQEALCTGLLIKKSSISLYAQLIKKMWYNQEDMMPLTRMVMIKRCERFINNE